MKEIITLSFLIFLSYNCSHLTKEPIRGPASKKTNSVQRERFLQDLEHIAAYPRTPNSSHLEEIGNTCIKRFKELGFKTIIDPFTYNFKYTFNIGESINGVESSQRIIEKTTALNGRNIIGILPGTSKRDEIVMLSAHYDSVHDCDGADDNATGVAGLFESARLLANKKYERTLMLACWDGEEHDRAGSKHFAKKAKKEQKKIVGSIVYEMIGFTNSEENSQMFPERISFIFPSAAEVLAKNKGGFIAFLYDRKS
ncbi:MAG: M20/M25/M40 family metallo-hydrolase [Bacteriovoracaceae bacterium]|nr:M20/M25/M40 family metallo-hydrolase [Bacteriovoracaceae bacterium]